MNALTFDTLATTRALEEAGHSQNEAEAIVKAIQTSQAGLFTKHDGQLLEKTLRKDAAVYAFGAVGVLVLAQVVLKALGLG